VSNRVHPWFDRHHLPIIFTPLIFVGKLGTASLIDLLRMSMIYRLFVQTPGGWELVCSVEATERDAALREAMLLLPAQHKGKPLRLVGETDPPEAGSK